MGTFEGGGTFTLFRIRSFDTDSSARVPLGFVEFDVRDFNRVAATGVIHLHETI